MSSRTKTSADKLKGKRRKKEKNVADNSSKSQPLQSVQQGHTLSCVNILKTYVQLQTS